MKVITRIDQNESIRRGIDAPSSTAKIEVDLALLSDLERDFIATHFKSGGLEEISFLERNYSLKAPSPTLDGLKEAIAKAIEWKKDRQIGHDAEVKKLKAEALDLAQRNMASKPCQCFLDDDNRRYPYLRSISTLIWNESLLDEPFRSQYKAWAEECRCTMVKSLEDAKAEQARDKAKAAKKAKKEYDACLARVPQVLKDRVAAGYGNEDEIDGAIRDIILEDNGLSSFNKNTSYYEDVVLTDDEFIAFERLRGEIQKKFPVSTIKAVVLRELGGSYTGCKCILCQFEYAGLTVDGFTPLTTIAAVKPSSVILPRDSKAAEDLFPLGKK